MGKSGVLLVGLAGLVALGGCENPDTVSSQQSSQQMVAWAAAKLEEERKTILGAAKHGDLKQVQALVAAGSNLGQRSATNGFTPLHWAVAGGHEDVVKLLLSHGASVKDKTKYGLTPLELAAVEGYDDIAALLRRHGAKE